MRPDNYVKETIRKIHGELLPEVTPEIVRMLPEPDFGRDIFDTACHPGFCQQCGPDGLSRCS